MINITKYQGENITNTCETLAEEVAQIGLDSKGKTVVCAEYDNSDIEYYHLDPGQFEIKDGWLNFRLKSDLNYEKYLTNGMALHINASFVSVAKVPERGAEQGGVGVLILNREYYDAHKNPTFMYSIPISGIHEDELSGKQILLSFAVAKYNSKGRLLKVYCNSMEVPLGPIEPSCCSTQNWKDFNLSFAFPRETLPIDRVEIKSKEMTGEVVLNGQEGSPRFDPVYFCFEMIDSINALKNRGLEIEKIRVEIWTSFWGIEKENILWCQTQAKELSDGFLDEFSSRGIEAEFVGVGENWLELERLIVTCSLDSLVKKRILGLIHSDLPKKEIKSTIEKNPALLRAVDSLSSSFTNGRVEIVFVPRLDQFGLDSKDSISIADFVAKKNIVGVPAFDTEETAELYMKVLDSLIHSGGTSPHAHAVLSTYYFNLGRISEAIKEIEIAINEQPYEKSFVWSRLLYYASNLWRLTAEKCAEFYYSLQPLREAYGEKRSFEVLEIAFLAGAGNLEYALVLLQKRNGNFSAQDFVNRAVLKHLSSRVTEAEADYRAALEKSPDLPEAYMNLSKIYAFKGLTAKSVEHFGKAVSLDPRYKSEINTVAFEIIKESPIFDKYSDGK